MNLKNITIMVVLIILAMLLLTFTAGTTQVVKTGVTSGLSTPASQIAGKVSLLSSAFTIQLMSRQASEMRERDMEEYAK